MEGFNSVTLNEVNVTVIYCSDCIVVSELDYNRK